MRYVPIVYLICFIDTNTFYIGYSLNGPHRIQNHFTHEKTPNGKPNYVYYEALKNKDIEVRVLKACKSKYEAKIWETKYIKDKRKLFGNRLLNILD